MLNDYNFNNKMQSIYPKTQAECILSPKEMQQRERRTKTLKKIDNQIESILSLNKQQHSQYQEFAQKLHIIEEVLVKQNLQLKQQNRCLTLKLSDMHALYNATKQQLQQAIQQLTSSLKQQQKLEGQVSKLKGMVKSQESLIDDYKRSIHEQLQIQKELVKSTYQHDRLTMEKQFNYALVQMEKQFQEKIKKVTQTLTTQNYKHQFQDLKKYLHSNKENYQQLKKSNSNTKNNIFSEYSTNDNDKRHNQAVYIP